MRLMLMAAVLLAPVSSQAQVYTEAEVAKRLKTLYKTFPPGRTIDTLTVVSTTVVGRSVTFRLTAPSLSPADYQTVLKDLPKSFASWYSISGLKEMITPNNVMFNVIVGFPAGQHPEIGIPINSKVCSQLNGPALESEVVVAAKPINQRFEDLKKRTAEVVAMVEATTSEQARKCDRYVDQNVAPIDLKIAKAGYINLTPKGEFETTAQYGIRRKSILNASAKNTLVIETTVDRDHLEYDADNQVIQIKPEAFALSGVSDGEPESGLAASLLLDQHGVDAHAFGNNVAVILRTADKTLRRYKAQNAFGASTNIEVVESSIEGILDRKFVPDGNILDESGIVFPVARASPHLVGTIPVSLAAAKLAKSSLRLAFVVQPKMPYLVSGTSAYPVKATMQNPQEINYRFSWLIADIQCGLAMDARGKVVGAFPTN